MQHQRGSFHGARAQDRRKDRSKSNHSSNYRSRAQDNHSQSGILSSPFLYSQHGVMVVAAIGSSVQEVSCLLNKVADAAIFREEESGTWHGEAESMAAVFSSSVWPTQTLKHYYHRRSRTVYLMLATAMAAESLSLLAANRNWRGRRDLLAKLWKNMDLPEEISHLDPLSQSEDENWKTEEDPLGALECAERDAMKAMLFVFSVSHTVLWVQTRPALNPHLLGTFRTLQACKLALWPVDKSRKLMSASGLLPVPPLAAGSSREASSLELLPGDSCPSLLLVVAAGPQGDSLADGSLEVYVRTAIRKCRVLAYHDAAASSSPDKPSNQFIGRALFALDPVRAVAWLDRGSLQEASSLISTTTNLDTMFASMIADRIHSYDPFQPGVSTDSESETIREFVRRQAVILRGKKTAGDGPAAGAGYRLPDHASWLAACRQLAIQLGDQSDPRTVLWNLCPEPSNMPQAAAMDGAPLNPEVELKAGLLKIPGGVSVPGLLWVPESPAGPSSPANADVASIVDSRIGDFVDADLAFCTDRCRKALPEAWEKYSEKLPGMYTEAVHRERLAAAVALLESRVKGRSVSAFVRRFKGLCEAFWMEGRQQCQAVSLTGRPCVLNKHHSDDVADESSRHVSGFVFRRSCLCGARQLIVDDPFSEEGASCTNARLADCLGCSKARLIPLPAGTSPTAKSDIPVAPLLHTKDQQLPRSSLPAGAVVTPTPFSVVVIGDSSSYDPKKGLPYQGFRTGANFLSRWEVTLPSRKFLKQQPNRESAIEALTSVLLSKVLPADDKTRLAKTATPGGRKGVPPVVPLDEAFPPLGHGQLASERGKGARSKNSMKFPGNDEEFPPLSASSSSLKPGLLSIPPPAVSSSGPAPGHHGHASKAAEETDTVSIYLGMEHTCPRGHRGFYHPPADVARAGRQLAAPPRSPAVGRRQQGGEGRRKRDLPGGVEQVPSGAPQGVAVGGTAVAILGDRVPLYVRCQACDKSKGKGTEDMAALPSAARFAGETAQLHRIFVVTPSHPVSFSTLLTVHFQSSQGGTHFGFESEVLLPRQSILSIYLPLAFTIPAAGGPTSGSSLDSPQQQGGYVLPWTAVRVAANQNFDSQPPAVG